MRLPPGPNCILDDCLPFQVSVLRFEPLKDPLRRMSLLLRSLLVGNKDLMEATEAADRSGRIKAEGGSPHTGANTGRGRASFCRYPGGSECDRIFFNACQPSLYFSQAPR